MPEQPNNKHGQAKPLPQCKAFLLCEEVYDDERSGRCSLLNLIEVMPISNFPGDSAAFMIFLQLYDGIGRYQLRIELHDVSDSMRVATALFTLNFTERLAKMDIALPVDTLRLPRPGRYELMVMLDGRELATQVFEAEVENGEKEN
jgi:hypothetical protein